MVVIWKCSVSEPQGEYGVQPHQYVLWSSIIAMSGYKQGVRVMQLNGGVALLDLVKGLTPE